jgi:hypothetical protein
MSIGEKAPAHAQRDDVIDREAATLEHNVLMNILWILGADYCRHILRKVLMI